MRIEALKVRCASVAKGLRQRSPNLLGVRFLDALLSELPVREPSPRPSDVAQEIKLLHGHM